MAGRAVSTTHIEFMPFGMPRWSVAWAAGTHDRTRTSVEQLALYFPRVACGAADRGLSMMPLMISIRPHQGTVDMAIRDRHSGRIRVRLTWRIGIAIAKQHNGALRYIDIDIAVSMLVSPQQGTVILTGSVDSHRHDLFGYCFDVFLLLRRLGSVDIDIVIDIFVMILSS